MEAWREMSGLGSAIDELAAEDLEATPTAVLADDLVELARARERLDAEWLRRLAAFDARGGAGDDEVLSTQCWVRRHCRLTAGAARERVSVARRLDEVPETAVAFAAGEIGYGHVRQLSAAAAAVNSDVWAESEPVLVDAARTLDPRGLTKVLAHWRHAVDPEAFVAAEADAHERRRFDISETFEAMTVLDGQLAGVDGAIVRSAIDAYEKPLPDDARTPTQRRADALVALARQALDRGELATTGGERPHLNVLVSLETLEGRARARGAELDWGGVISGEAARRLACDCGVSRIITAGKSEPLDVGRRMRTPSAALRRAVIARDRHCVEAGCDRPPGWCQVHHKKHWVDGGATRLEDLELRCDPHHYDVHEGQWKPERARRRRAQARPP
jgi:Domain of unknown function (DUF222)